MALKPSIIALAMGKPKPKGGSDDLPGLGSSKGDAIKEMFDAAKRGDWEAAQMAFHDAYEACSSDSGDDDDDDHTSDYPSDDDDED